MINSQQNSVTNPVRSPCISICLLNDQDICVGCFRDAKEITYWGSYDAKTKLEVLEKAKNRASQSQLEQ